LVEWAQQQQEKTRFNLEKINLFSAVKQSFELLAANALLKDILLSNSIAKDVYVLADALMLRSILQNLVTNSIKYSLNGGVINVAAATKDRMVEVSIMDAGIGMDAVTKDNLFTRQNGESVPGTNDEIGSGLGLILVKDFVSQHDGILRVESALKKGTCVYFTVPGYLKTLVRE
jgi:signal transduction histidine kinase